MASKYFEEPRRAGLGGAHVNEIEVSLHGIPVRFVAEP